MNDYKFFLGYPLDLLLNKECEFDNYKTAIKNKELVKIPDDIKPEHDPSGLKFPFEEKPGSGNIIIKGKPGSAKSTLALQLAVAAANEPNNYISFYITLEETPENQFFKCEQFNWDTQCKSLNSICNLDENESTDRYTELITRILTQPINCKLDFQSCAKHKIEPKKIKPQVIVSTLTPRNILDFEEKKHHLFIERYHQLEKLLAAAKYFNDLPDNINKIKLICIDSINIFGERLLNRTELFRLFDLFKRYEMMGIFIVEEDETSINLNEDRIHSDTIDYLADMVISLTTGEDDGYFMRYFEITKSRYQHQVYGKHPFKIISNKKLKDAGIKIFPSLHYLVYGTDIVSKK